MHLRSIRAVALVCLLVGFALASACGDDGDSAPTDDQDYADRIEEIEDEYADATEDIDRDDDAIIDDLEGFGDFASALGDLAGAYSELEPPAELQDEHNDYAGAVSDTAAAANDAFARADDAGSEDDAQQEIDDFFASDEVSESSAACAALQEAADAAEIAADYRCQGTSAGGNGPGDAGDYADTVTQIERDFADAIGAIDSDADPVEAFAGVTGALHDYVTAYANLQPPDEIADEHAAFVEAGEAIVDEAEEVLAQVDDAGSADEAQAIVDDFQAIITDADENFSDTCEELQSAADDADINADYRCP